MLSENKIKLNKTAKIAGKIITRTVAAIATICIVILTLYIVFNIVLGSALGLSHHVVMTQSMDPKIPAGSLVFIIETDFNNLKVGDVVSFYVDINRDGKDELITHNFVAYDMVGTKKYLITRGEKTPQDSWRIDENDFFGKCIFSIPKIGKLSRYLAHPLGTINLAINIVVVLIAMPLLSSKDKLALDDDDLIKRMSLKH
ncbi:MAG TPA: signal peptidase I [Clostridia bacterium]|nr:signal peptidase I [Clostridia bacterium]